MTGSLLIICGTKINFRHVFHLSSKLRQLTFCDNAVRITSFCLIAAYGTPTLYSLCTSLCTLFCREAQYHASYRSQLITGSGQSEELSRLILLWNLGKGKLNSPGSN